MRVAIIGNTGSGKSTLARQIAAAFSAVPLDLDTVVREPGEAGVPRAAEAAAADVKVFCTDHDRWIVEGCCTGLAAETLAYSPILLFVDPGVDACVSNCRRRPWAPHEHASKAEQDEKLEYLLSWVRGYYARDGDLSWAAHRKLFAEYRGLKLRLAHHHTTFLDDLGARFGVCAIPADEWRHAAHLAVGLWHVHRYGAAEALTRLRRGIRRLNESHGKVNTATAGYHETVTAAYVQLLAQYLDAVPSSMPLDMCAVALLAGPLAGRDVLLTFYSRERLMSAEARAGWVPPDGAPLGITAVLGGGSAPRQGES